MNASILLFPFVSESVFGDIPDDELVCTADSLDGIAPTLLMAAVVVWVGWFRDERSPMVRRRRELAAAVAGYLLEGAEPEDAADVPETAAWLIEKALEAPGSPLRRLA